MPGTRMQPRPGNTKKPGSAIGRLMWLDVRPDGAVTFRQNCSFRRSFACASRPRTEIAIHPINRFFQGVSKSFGQSSLLRNLSFGPVNPDPSYFKYGLPTCPG